MLKIFIRPSTELYLGNNLPLVNFIRDLGQMKIVLVADASLKDLYAVDLAKKIGAELVIIPSGEKGKNQETAQNVIEELFKMGCGRDTLLIALGGGVTTDLVGFVASIYMRGIPLILIPTTLLAMVDAAIGGKTGIDTPHGKNLIGTIYPAEAIFADLERIKTLPSKEWFNGLAEILKIGLIADLSIWKMAEKNEKDADLILKAIQGKIAIVEQDPKELGMRRILNFGHTIGHALETVSDYEMSHGEAVALGSLVEAYLSMDLGYLTKEEFESIERMYRRFSVVLPKNYDRDKFLSAMTHDKKKALGKIRFVLIDRIGHAIPVDGTYVTIVTLEQLEPTLDWMERRLR